MGSIAVCLLLVQCAPAIINAASAELRRLEPKDVLALRRPSDAQISPDGARIAFVISRFDADHKPVSEVWWVDPTGSLTRVTTEAGRHRLPRWSPDGSRLAYLEQPVGPGLAQIVAHTMNGGGTTILLDEAAGVRDFRWSPDGTRLAVLQRDPEARSDADDAVVIGVHARHTGLWIVDVRSGRKTRLGRSDLSFWTCRWSPDGKTIVALASQNPIAEGLEYGSRLTVVNVETGKQRVLAERTNAQAAPSYSPDGERIVFLAPLGEFKERGVPHLVAAAGGQATPLLEQHPGHAWDLGWHPKTGDLLIGLTEGTQSYLASVNLQGQVKRLVSVHYSLIPYWDAVWSLSANGARAAFLSEKGSPCREIWISTLDSGSQQRLTDLNSYLKRVELGAVEVVRWTNLADNKPVEGILVSPPKLDRTKRSPLVVWLHGGPAYNWGLGGHVNGWAQLLASRGYLVLLPNFRGSSGYGMEWMRASVRDWSHGPFGDVLSGVDSLIDKGLADANRLFLGGGSYGGYLSFWAVTHTDRFKAAFVRAGLSDVASAYALTDEPSFLIGYFGATPYDAPDLYRKASPLTFAAKASTPLLIVHGKDDARVPVVQGLRFHDALRHHGASVEMIVYPNEGHSIRGYGHRLDAISRMFAWFERWDPESERTAD